MRIDGNAAAVVGDGEKAVGGQFHLNERCMSLARREGGEIRSLYIPMRHPDTNNFDPAQVYGWLTDLIASGVRIVTHNGIYDFGWLRAEGGVVMPPPDRLEETGALATMWKYCEASARYIFGDLLGNTTADAILRALRQVGASGMNEKLSGPV